MYPRRRNAGCGAFRSYRPPPATVSVPLVTRYATRIGTSVTAITNTATTLVTGRCLRPHQLAQHPDRQRGLLAGGEGGDDDLVEGEGEGEHAAGEEGRRDVGQEDVAEGLEAVGTQVHRGLDQIGRGAAQAGDDVVVDHDDAEGRVADHDGPDRERDVEHAEGRAQRDAGDDAGQGDRQDQEQVDRRRGRRSGSARGRRRPACPGPSPVASPAGRPAPRGPGRARCPRAPRRRRTIAASGRAAGTGSSCPRW